MNTHVIHYEKLIERKQYLKPLLKNDVWHYAINKDNITQEQIDQHYTRDINEWTKRSIGIYADDPEYRELKAGDISCGINHMSAWKSFCEERDNSFGLFFEDDIILCDNFYDKLNEVMKAIPPCDAVFIGGGFPHTVAPTISQQEINGYNFITKTHPATNCVCSYILHKNIAKKMYEYLMVNKFVLPIDFEVNHMFRLFDAKIIHVMPMLCVEGSAIGYYNSVQSR
jgi:GR25 family glycosyltransferase involved in LPS biosynthesis